MPIYRDRKKWRIKVWFKGRPYSKVIAGTKAEAQEYEARWRVELASADPTVDTRVVPTFSGFCVNHYREHAQTHLKASSWRNRQYTLATLDTYFGDSRLTEIHLPLIEKYKAQRLRSGIRPSTVNDEIKVYLAVRNYAKSLGFAVADVKVKKIPVRGQRRVIAWTSDEVAQLYSATARRSPDLLPMLVFLLNTGCRRGEAIALEWINIDLARRIIRIWPGDEWQPKDNDAREIPINDALLPWLSGERRSERWVFPCPSSGERFAFWPQRAFDRARKAAGLTGGPHTCRHTYATHFLSTTPDLYLLARVLGHSYQRVTELYAHLLPDHLARAAKAVNLPAPVTPSAVEAGRRWGIDVKSLADEKNAETVRRTVRS